MGLQLKYNLQENSGTTVADSSGNGNNGTVAGGFDLATASVAGPGTNNILAKALRFTGVAAEAITGPNGNTILSGDTSWTIAAWVRTDSLQSGTYGLVAAVRYYGASKAGLGVNNLSTVSLRSYAGSSAKTINGSVSPNLNTWAHVAVTYNLTTNQGRLIVNGAADQAIAIGTVRSASSHPVAVGNVSAGGTLPFTGDVAGLAIFNSIATTQEIADLIAEGQALPDPTPPAYDSIIPYSKGLIYNRAITIGEDGVGLSYNPAIPYNFTGVPFQAADNGGSMGTLGCCALVGDLAETSYAVSAVHGGICNGETIKWLNSDNVTVTRTVSSTTHLGSAGNYYTPRVYKLSAPINAATDKLKIYSVATNTDTLLYGPLVTIEASRKLTGRRVIEPVGSTLNHGVLVHGHHLGSGDSGKPNFVAYDGELYLVGLGTVTASGGPAIAPHLDAIDAVLAATSDSLDRVTLPDHERRTPVDRRGIKSMPSQKLRKPNLVSF